MRTQLVVGRHNSEAQEHEDAHESVAIGSVAFEADEDLVAVELLLGELEQRDEGVARALGQHARRHVDVEHAVDEQRAPLDLALVRQRILEAEQNRVGLVGDLLEVNVLLSPAGSEAARGRSSLGLIEIGR